MVCYNRNRDGWFETQRTFVLSDEITARIKEDAYSSYRARVEARIKRDKEIYSSIVEIYTRVPTPAEKAPLETLSVTSVLPTPTIAPAPVIMSDLLKQFQVPERPGERARAERRRKEREQRRQEARRREARRAAELKRKERLRMEEDKLARLRRQLARRGEKLEELEGALAERQEEVEELEDDLRRERGKLARREDEIEEREGSVSAREDELGSFAQGLKTEKARLRERWEELQDKESMLDQKKKELGQLFHELKREEERQAKGARRLEEMAAGLAAEKLELEEARRRDEAERRGRYNEARAKAEALAAAFDASHGPEMARWREKEYQEARKAVSEARKLVAAGELPKAQIVMERASVRLEEIEKQAFEEERRQEERKKATGVLASALRQLGCQRVAAKMRSPSNPRSHVDVFGRFPSGKSVMFSLLHGGTMEIRQQGVSGHEECHSVEDAIERLTKKLGLKFAGGHKMTSHKRRPGGVPMRAVREAKREAR